MGESLGHEEMERIAQEREEAKLRQHLYWSEIDDTSEHSGTCECEEGC